MIEEWDSPSSLSFISQFCLEKLMFLRARGHKYVHNTQNRTEQKTQILLCCYIFCSLCLSSDRNVDVLLFLGLIGVEWPFLLL